MALAWFVAQTTFLIYGISTDQIGFVLLFVINLAIMFLGIFIKLDKDREGEDGFDD